MLELQRYPTASVITLFIAGTTYDVVLWIVLVIRVYQACECILQELSSSSLTIDKYRWQRANSVNGRHIPTRLIILYLRNSVSEVRSYTVSLIWFPCRMYIVCAVLFIKLPSTKLLISTAISHLLQTMASVLSARFILHLRSYLNDLSIQSISVSPERIMRVEDERKLGFQTYTDDSLDSIELAPR